MKEFFDEVKLASLEDKLKVNLDTLKEKQEAIKCIKKEQTREYAEFEQRKEFWKVRDEVHNTYFSNFVVFPGSLEELKQVTGLNAELVLVDRDEFRTVLVGPDENTRTPVFEIRNLGVVVARNEFNLEWVSSPAPDDMIKYRISGIVNASEYRPSIHEDRNYYGLPFKVKA